MRVEFYDQQSGDAHWPFQEWRRIHPSGFFLTFDTKRRARLHLATCLHPGSVDWTFEAAGHSLTKARKVCDDNEEALLAWAESEDVAVSGCADCLRGRPATKRRAVSPGAERVVAEAAPQVGGSRAGLATAPGELTAFSWGYWGWGNTVPPFLAAAAAAEAARGFEPPAFADVRLRRSVRAPGFSGTAFEKAVGQDRYRWFGGLGNARIATHEGGVQIARPRDAQLLLDYILDQWKLRRRVLFFCACATDQPQLCHRHTVAGFLLRAARRRGIDLSVVEWPGGEPVCREVRLDATQWKRAGGRTVPLGTTLPKDGLATLPWGSTVVIRSAAASDAMLTGPAIFKREWKLPKLGVADADGRVGYTLEQQARALRKSYSCNERHS
jgi:hypothetical protein